jgi:7-cyano-7-deazaguanine synthase
MKRTLLILSGGLDSTTVLHKLIADGHTVSAVSFDYGQKHRKELEYAKMWTVLLGIPHEIVPLAGVFAGSALTHDADMPMGEYSVETMKVTVVPNRNMVMLAIAISKAIQGGYDAVAYGAHASDRDVYPDCRYEFVSAMRAAARLCDWTGIEILAPLLDMTKRDVIELAKSLGFDYARTWSCYEGGDEPCGQCGACRSREEAKT